MVAFLNAQMPGIEVLAVEIKRFHGKSAQTLVPRVIGRTSAASTSGRRGQRLTPESFLEGFADEDVRVVTERLLGNSLAIGWRNILWGVWGEHSGEKLGLAAADQCCLVEFANGEAVDEHTGLLVRCERARI